LLFIPPLGTQIYVAIPFYPTLGVVLGSVLIPYFLGFWMGYRTGPTRVVFVPEIKRGSDADDEPSNINPA
jgi:hypothetical protein